ncbi:hypothetical protein LPJ73_008533 [Coemansia sp. RSA 2703]|nr:hypothetical protein LPJ73_008533 [Coemansia sp. RSA 2703]
MAQDQAVVQAEEVSDSEDSQPSEESSDNASDDASENASVESSDESSIASDEQPLANHIPAAHTAAAVAVSAVSDPVPLPEHSEPDTQASDEQPLAAHIASNAAVSPQPVPLTLDESELDAIANVSSRARSPTASSAAPRPASPMHTPVLPPSLDDLMAFATNAQPSFAQPVQPTQPPQRTRRLPPPAPTSARSHMRTSSNPFFNRLPQAAATSTPVAASNPFRPLDSAPSPSLSPTRPRRRPPPPPPPSHHHNQQQQHNQQQHQQQQVTRNRDRSASESYTRDGATDDLMSLLN